MAVTEKSPLLGDGDQEEEELTGCGGSLPCNPRRAMHRYLVLIIMCFLSFGKFQFVIKKPSTNSIISHLLLFYIAR